MSKRKTREQKILSTLRKLQSQQPSFSINHKSNGQNLAISPKPMSQPKTALFKGISGYSTTQTNYSYLKKDLLKIFILAILAIGIQIMLSLFKANLKLPF